MWGDPHDQNINKKAILCSGSIVRGWGREVALSGVQKWCKIML